MSRTRTALATAAFFAAAVLLAACAEPLPENPPEPEDLSAQAVQEVQVASDAWALAAAEADPEAFASFYTDDAVVLYEQSADVVGIEALSIDAAEMMADPNFELVFAADRIEAARSGDLAWEHGTWSMTMTGPEGEPATVDGTYLAVWRKNENGEWKCVADAPVSGAPMAGM